MQNNIDLIECENLRNFIVENEIDLNTVVSLSVEEVGITSLKGLNCPKLEELYCYDNLISSFEDLNCPKLKDLNCINNLISSLRELNCPNLKYLYCSDNQISNFEDLNFPKLELLSCRDNQVEIFESKNIIFNPNSQRIAIYLNNKIYCGCFCGTVQQFIDAAIEKYGSDHLYVDWAKQFIQ